MHYIHVFMYLVNENSIRFSTTAYVKSDYMQLSVANS